MCPSYTMSLHAFLIASITCEGTCKTIDDDLNHEKLMMSDIP